MSRAFRSGWCGLDARPWQHERCAGQYRGHVCCCICHTEHGADEALVELVQRRDLAGLAADLEALAGRPGVWPPSVRRLRSAAVELLGEVAR